MNPQATDEVTSCPASGQLAILGPFNYNNKDHVAHRISCTAYIQSSHHSDQTNTLHVYVITYSPEICTPGIGHLKMQLFPGLRNASFECDQSSILLVKFLFSVKDAYYFRCLTALLFILETESSTTLLFFFLGNPPISTPSIYLLICLFVCLCLN